MHFLGASIGRQRSRYRPSHSVAEGQNKYFWAILSNCEVYEEKLNQHKYKHMFFLHQFPFHQSMYWSMHPLIWCLSTVGYGGRLDGGVNPGQVTNLSCISVQILILPKSLKTLPRPSWNRSLHFVACTISLKIRPSLQVAAFLISCQFEVICQILTLIIA